MLSTVVPCQTPVLEIPTGLTALGMTYFSFLIASCLLRSETIIYRICRVLFRQNLREMTVVGGLWFCAE